MESNNIPTKSMGCCGSFWGPFRPLFGGHTLKEAGSSAWLPTPILAIWRLAAAGFLLGVYIYYTRTGYYEIQFLSVLVLVLMFASFFLSGLCSVLYSLKKDLRAGFLASFTVFWFQTALTTGILATIVFWTLIFEYDRKITLGQLTPHGIHVALAIADLFLGFRMQFRLFFIVIGMLLGLVYIGFLWIWYARTGVFLYAFLDYRKSSVGIAVGYQAATLAAFGVLGIVSLLINRINRCACAKPGKSDDEKPTSVPFDYNL